MKVLRKLVKIDESKCNGCGACVSACHEGAIALINGKARLVREDYCDGLGDCLPACPVDAISIQETNALPYDDEAVKAAQAQQASHCACPGKKPQNLLKPQFTHSGSPSPMHQASELRQWPVQIKLVPSNAPFFNQAHLLIAADCSAYAYARFHEDFIRDKICIIGCPKLDSVNYATKLADIFIQHTIQTITLVRMQVPCCGGLEMATKQALLASQKDIPLKIVTLTANGQIV